MGKVVGSRSCRVFELLGDVFERIESSANYLIRRHVNSFISK